MGFNRVGWQVGCGTCIGPSQPTRSLEWLECTDHLDILQLQIHSSGKNPGWSRPLFSPCGRRSVWNLNGDCLDVTYWCSSRRKLLALCPFYRRKSRFWRWCPFTKYQQDIPVWFSSQYSTKTFQGAAAPLTSWKKKDTNVGTRDQPLKVTLMLSSCKNSPVARHLPWRPGKWFGHTMLFFFQRVWHTWYENRGCLELEDVNVNFLVAFPKKL